MSNPKSLIIEIPVESFEELNLIRMNLLTAIGLIADHNEHSGTSRSSVTYSIGTLTYLIRYFEAENQKSLYRPDLTLHIY